MFHITSLKAVAYCRTHSGPFVSNLQECVKSQFPFPKAWCHFHVTYVCVSTDCGSKTLKKQGILESMGECMFSNNTQQQIEQSVSKCDETLQNAAKHCKMLQMALKTLRFQYLVHMVQRNSLLSLFIAVKLRT